MRNTTSELSDRIHLLRLSELLLEQGLVRQVPHRVNKHSWSEVSGVDLKDPVPRPCTSPRFPIPR